MKSKEPELKEQDLQKNKNGLKPTKKYDEEEKK